MKSYTFIIRLLCVTMNTNFDVRKETQKERTYTLDGLINGRGGGSYIQDNIFVRKWMGLHPEGFKVGFYGKLLPL